MKPEKSMNRQLNPMEDFRRDITHHALRRPDGRIVLTATLRDRYHDILLEVVADGDSLVIEGARVEFRACPTSDCPNVSRRLDRLTGVTIGKGLNRSLQEALGGAEGCGNLRNLLLGLLPLAINVRAGSGFTDEREMLDTIHQQLAGTCAGYPPTETV